MRGLVVFDISLGVVYVLDVILERVERPARHPHRMALPVVSAAHYVIPWESSALPLRRHINRSLDRTLEKHVEVCGIGRAVCVDYVVFAWVIVQAVPRIHHYESAIRRQYQPVHLVVVIVHGIAYNLILATSILVYREILDCIYQRQPVDGVVYPGRLEISRIFNGCQCDMLLDP